MQSNVQMYESEIKPTWCPGCGDFGVLRALLKAFAELQIPPHELVVVSGIGCSSNLPHFVNAYGFHGVHGRAVPVATGIHLANPQLTVVITGGDGDGYGIGLGHFVHAMRRNLDITYVVMDNEIYGLTTGQTSPTSEKGMKTKSSPEGAIDSPINPIALALGAGASYVSRGFSGDPNHMAELIKNGIKHKGFALVDVFSPCVTYNKQNTYQWFRQRVYKLEEKGHDPHDMAAAYARSLEWGDKIPIGLFYEVQKPTYAEEEPGLKLGPLTQRVAGIPQGMREELLAEFY